MHRAYKSLNILLEASYDVLNYQREVAVAARPEAFNSVMIFIQMNGETVFVKGGQLLRERERTKTVWGDRFCGGTKNFVTGPTVIQRCAMI